MKCSCFLVLAVTIWMGAVAMGQTSAPAVWDTAADTWAATDALGRPVPMHDTVGPPRPDRYVGIFYFLWMGQHGTDGPYDITKILAREPGAMTRPASPPWGPESHFHFWGEPLFGYYRSDDAWVLRKHAQMLADAGVDVVIFDVTNQTTYAKVYTQLCEVFTAVRRDGGRTPQIAFLCPFWDPPRVAAELYENLYKPGRYRDLWFQWKGKPLLLADREKVAPGLRDFFTFRKPQPDYFAGPGGPNEWGWLEISPQHVFRDEQGRAEQMTVGVAQNGSGRRLCAFSEKNTYGRSWHDGGRDDRPDAVRLGLNFAAQWEQALKVDPEFVFVTGWNEWIAMRLPAFGEVREPVMFVDQYTQEYSRDIEPMKGGHGDDYYYQMVGYIRRFKGVRKPPAPSGRTAIRIDGKFEDWREVRPEYRDDAGDTMRRDHAGYDAAGHYVNRTGRNDFVLMKVARNDGDLCFYARTRDPITAREGTNWMTLLVDANGDATTGWQGFDLVVNREARGANAVSVESLAPDGRTLPCGEAACRVAGNEIEIGLPRALLRRSARSGPAAFKWADNIQGLDPMEFIVNGDTAPNGRFVYRIGDGG